MDNPCKATKTVTIFDFIVIDEAGKVVQSGSVTASDLGSATIQVARDYPKAEPRHIILKAWATAEVRDPDAIATVRVVGSNVTPAKGSKAE